MDPFEVLLEFEPPVGAKKTGPKGGNLDNPAQSDYRRSPLNAPVNEQGVRKLHTNEKNGWRDTAVCGIMDEQPWHHMAALGMLAGRTNNEIAQAAGVTATYISNLRAQRWFSEKLALLANEQKNGLIQLLNGAAVPALERIVQMAESSENERVKLAANITLLEHAHGKAVQKVVGVHATANFSSPQEEMETIQRELADLRKQLPSNLQLNNSAAGDEGTHHSDLPVEATNNPTGESPQ
jgi:hypothetical protein